LGGFVRSDRESGHLLVTLMVALMVLAILMTVGFQQWSVIHRREMEHELIFRGGQYVEAIIRYRMDHAGALPLDLEDLIRPGPSGHRYIRKMFTDPFDRDEEGWGLLYLGPGGKWIFDPQAAERAAELMGQDGGADLLGSQFGNAGLSQIGPGSSGSAQMGQQIAGMQQPGGAGINPGGGLTVQGSPAAGTGGLARTGRGQMDAIPNQIVGVVSRSGDKAFFRHAQRDYYWDWQFHIFAVIRQTTPGFRPSQPVPQGGGLGPGGKLGPPPNKPNQP
jgi:type II secretory pathway pseudopilin PulG